MDTSERSLARHQRIYGKLLLAYPRAFRQVYEADMLQVFGDRLRDEQTRAGRRAGFRIWAGTLGDLFRSVPVQRMEETMSREAAFAILFALILTVAVAAFAMGIGDIAVTIGLGALIIAAIAFGASGVFRKENARNATASGKIGPRELWVVLAAIMGVAEIALLAGQLIDDPRWENVVALAVFGCFGLVALAGCWLRSRSRSSGDWMIVVGILPFAALWWLIVPAILVVVVSTMAVIDNMRRPATRTVG